MTQRLGPSFVAVALLLLSVTRGGRPFAFAVLVAAAVALLHISAALDATGPRPIVAAAAVGALGVPLRLLVDPNLRLDTLPGFIVAMVLTAFVAAMIAGRRSDIARAISATFVCGLLVALGAGGLLLLRESRAGLRWTVALLLLILVPEAAAFVALRARGMTLTAREAVRFVAAAAVGGALLAIAGRPLTPGRTAALVAVCLAAMYAGALVHRVVRAESAAADQAAGLALRPTVALLLAAPLVFFLATATQA